MSWLTDLFKIIFPVALDGLKLLADSEIDGAKLNKDQKSGLYLTYIALKTNFKRIVESTENDYDDQTLQKLVELAEDTLTEAGIEIPIIPPEILSE